MKKIVRDLRREFPEAAIEATKGRPHPADQVRGPKAGLHGGDAGRLALHVQRPRRGPTRDEGKR